MGWGHARGGLRQATTRVPVSSLSQRRGGSSLEKNPTKEQLAGRIFLLATDVFADNSKAAAKAQQRCWRGGGAGGWKRCPRICQGGRQRHR